MSAAAALESPHAALLCDFVNSLEHEDDGQAVEHLGSAADLSRWLAERGLVTGTPRATSADLDLALRLRLGLRQALVAHDQTHPAAASGPDDAIPPQLTRELPLQLTVDADGPRLAPAVAGVRGGLAEVLVAVAGSHADGSWPRVKICAADDCRWAFVDGSKNRSRHWCDMDLCGNRAKTRAYRARHRGLPGSAGG
jgi:predicted RNA-binding Zn ribbon-like protein